VLFSICYIVASNYYNERLTGSLREETRNIYKYLYVILVLGIALSVSGTITLIVTIIASFYRVSGSLIEIRILVVVTCLWIIFCNIFFRFSCRCSYSKLTEFPFNNEMGPQSPNLSDSTEHKSNLSSSVRQTNSPHVPKSEFCSKSFYVIFNICPNIIDITALCAILQVCAVNVKVSPSLYFGLFSFTARLLEIFSVLYLCRFDLFPNFYRNMISTVFVPIANGKQASSTTKNKFQHYDLETTSPLAFKKCIICDIEVCSGQPQICRKCSYMHDEGQSKQLSGKLYSSKFKRQHLPSSQEESFPLFDISVSSSKSIPYELSPTRTPRSTETMSLGEILNFGGRTKSKLSTKIHYLLDQQELPYTTVKSIHLQNLKELQDDEL